MNNGRILLVLLCGICFSFYSSAAGLENTSGEADYTLENIEHYSPFSDTNAAWYFKLKQLRLAGDEYVNLKFRLVDLRGQKEYYWNSVLNYRWIQDTFIVLHIEMMQKAEKSSILELILWPNVCRTGNMLYSVLRE